MNLVDPEGNMMMMISSQISINSQLFILPLLLEVNILVFVGFLCVQGKLTNQKRFTFILYITYRTAYFSTLWNFEMMLSKEDMTCLKRHFKCDDRILGTIALSDFEYKLMEEISSKWSELVAPVRVESCDVLESLNAMEEALTFLETAIRNHITEFGTKKADISAFRQNLTLRVKAILFGSISPTLANGLRRMFKAVFQAFVICNNGNSELIFPRGFWVFCCGNSRSYYSGH